MHTDNIHMHINYAYVFLYMCLSYKIYKCANAGVHILKVTLSKDNKYLTTTFLHKKPIFV